MLDARVHRQPKGYVQQSVTTAANLSTIPSPCDYALIRVSGANIRYRDDGTNPTTSVGVPVNAGEILQYDGQVGSLVVVSQAGTATLDITYYA